MRPSPADPDLVARGQGDGVGARYQTMYDRGELWVYPQLPDYSGWFNSWRMLARTLVNGPTLWPPTTSERSMFWTAWKRLGWAGWPIHWRRMGSGPDGNADVLSFQRLILEQAVMCRESLLVRAALGDSMIRFDANGNSALDKRRQRGKIDVLSAGVLAAGLWERLHNAPARRGYIGLVPNE